MTTINDLKYELEKKYPNIFIEYQTKNLDKTPYSINVLNLTSSKIAFFVISFQHNNPKESFYVVVEDPRKLNEFIEKMYFNQKYTAEECFNYCKYLLK
jgi:hypothetical protein